MPPKRAATKRKAESDGSDAEEVKPSTSKKAKTTKAEERPGNGQPTNKVLPVNIVFPKKHEGCMRIATWNVCGLATSQKKGFKFYVEAEDPDILVLSETKVNNETVDPALKERFPYSYWSIAEKKSYSGTAILSKHKALSVTRTLPGHPDPNYTKGRIVTLEFDNTYVVGTYVPNAGTGLKTLNEKNLWNEHFTTYIRHLDKKKPVIWTGDLNVAPTAIDLANPKTNWNKTPGYTEAETTAFKNILNPPADSSSSAPSDSPPSPKFIDVWRHLHPDTHHYTYFSYRFRCREKNLGWRLDMFVLSERLLERVKMCEIRDEIYGASDHCPVVMEIEGAL